MFGMVLNQEAHWFPRAPLRLLRAAAQYTRFALLSGVSLRQQWRDLPSPAARALWSLGVPIGHMLALRDLLRRTT